MPKTKIIGAIVLALAVVVQLILFFTVFNMTSLLLYFIPLIFVGAGAAMLFMPIRKEQ